MMNLVTSRCRTTMRRAVADRWTYTPDDWRRIEGFARDVKAWDQARRAGMPRGRYSLYWDACNAMRILRAVARRAEAGR